LLNLKELYLRIDQEELEKLGVADKQELTETVIPDLHEYSMLQRFRQSKDYRQPDKYKPSQKVPKSKKSGSSYTTKQST
jgi:hypothetical protein